MDLLQGCDLCWQGAYKPESAKPQIASVAGEVRLKLLLRKEMWDEQSLQKGFETCKQYLKALDHYVQKKIRKAKDKDQKAVKATFEAYSKCLREQCSPIL